MNHRWTNFSLTARGVRFVLVLVAVSFIVVYVALALSRIAYPYELEWMEGGILDHVARLLSGKGLYIEPSLEFTPFVYTPLYYYISAGFAKVFGSGLFPLRLVSFLASLGSMAILFAFTRRETGSAVLGILSAGLFAAAFNITGAWYDIARVDSLFVLLLLSSVYVFRHVPSFSGLLLAGVLMSLSVLTKQIALVACLTLSVYSVAFLPRKVRFVFPLVVVIIVGLATLVLNWSSNGWFWYYVFELPRRHPVSMEKLVGFWVRDIGMLSIAFGMSLVYVISLVRDEKWKDAVFYVLLMAGMVGASWISRLHSGNYINVLIPAVAVIALVFPLGLQVLLPGYFYRSRESKPAPGREFALSDYLVVFLCVAQFLSLAYDPMDQVPTSKDRAAGDGLVQKLTNIDGEVFIPFHGYLATLSGKKPYAHIMALSDVIRSNDRAQGMHVMKQLADAFRKQRFSAVILDGEDRLGMEREVKQWYFLQGRVFNTDDVFYPVTGALWRPEFLYLPRKN
ncbi:MAG: hypothetical protein GXO82_01380 [Chlorobi bacterium]|nr:hypothetical protein [Chlorobiota bacterium]